MLKLQSTVMLACLSLSTAAHAFVVAPPGLSDGDEYRYVFVTSTLTDATSDQISIYNGFVQSAADNSAPVNALGLTWSAIASTSSVDARDNTGTNPNTDGAGVPLYLLDGTKIADDYNDLWDGSIDAPLNLTETGVTLISAGEFDPVWAGSESDGTASVGPLGSTETFGASFGAYSGTGNWITEEFTDPVNTLPVYAISGVITVPEPTSLALLGLGGLLFMKRR